MKYQLPEFYTQQLTIKTYDVNRERELKLSSQLKLQQEVGELHLLEGNLPYAKLYDMGMAWVLTRSHAVRHRTPRLEEKVTLTTWSKMIKGAQFFRCYYFQDQEGTPLISAISSFALVDAKTHALLRPTILNDIIDFSCQPDKQISCPLPGRGKPEGEKVAKDTRPIRYTDIDYNDHLNNTVYADFMEDFFPGNLKEKRIREFEINFLKEAVLGDTLKITVTRQENKYFYSGEHDNGQCFEEWCLIENR